MGGRCKDITGKKFGRLTALYPLHNLKSNGVTHCLSEWCEIYNLNYKVIETRLHRGWDIIKALEG